MEEVKTCSDYLTKALFSIPQDIKKRLVININNKGAKDSFGVSAIRMEPNELVNSDIIQRSIDSVLAQTPSREIAPGCPDYIMDVVHSFVDSLKEQGITLEVVSNKDYQVVLKASTANGGAMLRMWYGTSLENHTKGFINKIDVFDISDPDITNKVRQMRTLIGQ